MEPKMEGVAEFYAGKSVLITGVAGFIGEFLLEALLRCCPGIQTVYGVLRDKRGVKAEDRKEALFKKKIFKKLLNHSPVALKKFQLVLGDVSMPNLGINETDLRIITQDVSIVFHAAACINFLKPAKFVLTNNALGTHYVVELCKKMKNLQALIYTSTSYSNCNRKSKIKEIIYRLPHTSDYFIDTILTGSNEDCEQMMSECQPAWPNSYTFSKCLAENILLDQASDLNVAIIRPSVVFASWKEPIIGYVEDNSAIASFSIAVGKGFMRTMYFDDDILFEITTVDVVANSHIVAGYLISTERVSSPFVVNCVSYGKLSDTTYKEYYEDMKRILYRYTLPRCFQTPNFTFKTYKNRVAYLISAAYHHYIPAYALDGLLKLSGKKPKLVRLYRFADQVMLKMKYFAFNSWAFETENLDKLERMINHEDRQVFYTDLTGFNLETAANIPLSSPFYDWNTDKRTPEQRMKIARQRNMLWVFIQRVTLICFIVLLYLVISLIL